ncbi:MAG: UDP-N-acetylmuramate--L-alanine ligase [Ktedonobacteraceae bacterium]
MSQSCLHFMGIGGQGISAVAQMALQAGEIVTGCDQNISATTRALEQAGITVYIGHSVDHLNNVDTLVISPAVPALNPNNPELLAARGRGLRVITWQELLGELFKGKLLLSVCGVHGKGTTTALLSLMLTDAGFDPTCEIGAVVPRFGANYRLGKSDYVVNEADEFNHNFWHYHPRLVVVKALEFEHPEFFADYEAFLAAFEHFVRGMDMQNNWPLPPTLIVNSDSSGCLDLLARLPDWTGQIITYSVEGLRPVAGPLESELVPDAVSAGYIAVPIVEQATFEAYDVRLDGETSFRVRNNGVDLAEQQIHLQLPGAHNVENALAALVAARTVGAAMATLVKTIESFGGIRRRFEIRHRGPLQVNGQLLDVMIIDDYAHHPTAIAATLEATRQRYPNRRIVAVYQPHMYSRTKTFFEQFLPAFDEADVAIIADIFPARERDTGIVHARDLVHAMAQRKHFGDGAVVLHGGSVQETAQIVQMTLCSGDIVLIMGAGDIYTLTEQLLLHHTHNTAEPRGNQP